MSLAVCKAGAVEKGVPLYRHIADLAGNAEVILPVPVSGWFELAMCGAGGCLLSHRDPRPPASPAHLYVILQHEGTSRLWESRCRQLCQHRLTVTLSTHLLNCRWERASVLVGLCAPLVVAAVQ